MKQFIRALSVVILLMACNRNQIPLSEEEQTQLSLFNLSVIECLEDTHPDSAIALARKILVIQDKITDTSVIFNAFVQIGKTYGYKQQFDTSLAYYQQAYDYVKDGGNHSRIAKALHWLGDVHIDIKKYDTATAYLLKAIKINRELGLLLPLATNYSILGHTLNAKLQYDSSLAYFYRAGMLFDSMNDPSRRATILSNIGDVYRSINDFENALRFNKEALNIHDSLGNIREVARIQNTIGIIHMNKGKYDSAIYYYQQSIPNAKSVGYDFVALIARFNLGKVYSLAGYYDQANPILNEIYQFCIDNNITEGQIRCLLRLGQNKLETGNFQKAKSMLNEGLHMAEENNNLDLQKEFLTALIRLSDETSGHGMYISYYKQLHQIEDSINLQALKLKVAQTEALYENKKKEARIENLALQNKYLNLRNRHILAILALLVLTSLFVLFYYRKRNQVLKQNNLLSAEENKLKQLSLEKIALESKLKDEMISKQKLSIDKKTQELVYSTLNQSRLIELNHHLTSKLTPLSYRQKTKSDQHLIQDLLAELNRVNNRKPLKEFEQLFIELHPDFYTNLSTRFSDISPRELQICALISLNLQTKDVSNITNISVSSLETMRYRIRKKMGLTKNQNLAVELMKF